MNFAAAATSAARRNALRVAGNLQQRGRTAPTSAGKASIKPESAVEWGRFENVEALIAQARADARADALETIFGVSPVD